MYITPKFSTIAELFVAQTGADGDPSQPVYSRKIAGKYENISYGELREMVEQFATGLLELGVKYGDRVGIISENRLEWVVASFAASCIGAADVPIFPTLSAKQVEYIYGNCGAVCIICSNALQLGKVIKAQPALPELRQIIVMNAEAKSGHHLVKTMSEVSALGAVAMLPQERALMFVETAVRVEPDDLATIIYTSGTTGNPKGVMLTHGNLCANMTAALERIEVLPSDIFLSYLPLCHSYERMAGFYASFASGSSTAFAESIEKVPENIREVRPTLLTSVPRLFEKIRLRTLTAIEKEKPAKQKIFHWAIAVGTRYVRQLRTKGKPDFLTAMQYRLAYKLVFSKISARLGGRLRLFVSGGAALSVETSEFFLMLGFLINEGYGLTETSPCLTLARLGEEEIGAVGKPLSNVEIKIADDGEILARGPSIMKGYWDNPAATAEAIDADGWFHTGDVGMFTAKGNLKITDRKKHIFVSSGGKNIAPLPIESAVTQSKYIEYCVLIGERREYCTGLIVLEFEQVRAAVPETTDLSNAALAVHPEVNRLIGREINERLKDFSKFERIRRFAILPASFSVETGELTPKLNVKRKVVEEKFAAEIERMYEGEEAE